MFKRLLCIVALVITAAASGSLTGKETALKTNLLYDATASVNLGIEQVVSPHWSLDLNADFNAWNMRHGARWKHWFVQPEARYWFCQPTGGHFLAMHLIGGQFNIGQWRDGGIWGIKVDKLNNDRFQGWALGAGVGYGYSWMLGKHWNLEAEIAVGYAYAKYDKFECKDCGRKVGSNHYNYVGPTKAAINLVYVF